MNFLDSIQQYKIVATNNCILVFGAIPMTIMPTLCGLVPENSVMGFYAAQLANANFAFGLPDDLRTLEEQLKPEALRRVREEYRHSSLSETAITWLAIGEHGRSSKALFHYLTHGHTLADQSSLLRDHPHDPPDFARCRKMLEQVPELTERLPQIADLSPVWGRLFQNWDDICAAMDKESPRWREHIGYSKEADKLISAAANPA